MRPHNWTETSFDDKSAHFAKLSLTGSTINLGFVEGLWMGEIKAGTVDPSEYRVGGGVNGGERGKFNVLSVEQ